MATDLPVCASGFRPCALVPVFNQPHRLAEVVAGLRQSGLPVLLVDDGSNAQTAAVVSALCVGDAVRAVRHPHNRGKGAAVSTGLNWARELAFTHVLQVDADGQHRLEDAATLLDAARARPLALMSGRPVFSADIPAMRRYSRYLTHFWVWVHTLSLDIPDSMCGFRVYPLAGVCPLLAGRGLGARMSFDTEVLVRYHWTGADVLFIPTPVRYHADGVSHFRMFEDNLRLTAMHTRLFFGMLLRLPVLLIRNRQRRRRRNAPMRMAAAP